MMKANEMRELALKARRSDEFKQKVEAEVERRVEVMKRWAGWGCLKVRADRVDAVLDHDEKPFDLGHAVEQAIRQELERQGFVRCYEFGTNWWRWGTRTPDEK